MPVNLSLMPLNLIKPIRFTQGRVAVLLIQVNILQLNRRVLEFTFFSLMQSQRTVTSCHFTNVLYCIVM